MRLFTWKNKLERYLLVGRKNSIFVNQQDMAILLFMSSKIHSFTFSLLIFVVIGEGDFMQNLLFINQTYDDILVIDVDTDIHSFPPHTTRAIIN